MLPQELCDYIVDFCHSDVDALRACSLASRALHRSSKSHIFRAITINSVDALNRFCKLLFTSPDVAPFVQELFFNTYRHFMRREPFVWIHHTVALPVRLKRLKTIGFSYVRFSDLAGYPVMPAFYENLSRYRGIRELRICSCDFEHIDALADFISTFAPRREQGQASPFALSLDCVSWGVPARVLPSRLDLCLTSFTIVNYSRADLVVSWLRHTPSLKILRVVTFKCVMGRELEVVGNFLRHLGDVLEYLQLGIRLDSVPRRVDVRTCFNLSRNVSLRSLHLRILDLDRHFMPWVPALLLQVAHLPLQNLTFDIWLHMPAQLDSPIWDDIEAILSSNGFKTVQNVLFIHQGALGFAETREALEKRFPALVQRRMLTVRDCSQTLRMCN